MGAATWIAALLCAAASCYFVYGNLHPVLRTSALGTEKALVCTAASTAVHLLFYLLLTLLFVGPAE